MHQHLGEVAQRKGLFPAITGPHSFPRVHSIEIIRLGLGPFSFTPQHGRQHKLRSGDLGSVVRRQFLLYPQGLSADVFGFGEPVFLECKDYSELFRNSGHGGIFVAQ